MGKCLVCNIQKEIMNGLNLDYSYLNEQDLNKTMNELLNTNQEYQEISFQYPFVFMHDYTEDEMDTITNHLKQNQVYAIYAVSTPYNINWQLNHLLNELLEEHETFQTINELQTLMKEFIPLMNNNQEIKNLLMEAFIILQEKNLSQMKNMIQKLNTKKKSDY